MTATVTAERVAFEILGLPAPQGSKSRMPNGAMVEGSSATGRAALRDWRTAVATTALSVATGLDGPLDGPLVVHVRFRFPMPASRPRRVRDRGVGWKSTKPDLDKLQRALGDGLAAGGLIAEDARIAEWHATKVEVIGWTGAEVVVSPAPEGRIG